MAASLFTLSTPLSSPPRLLLLPRRPRLTFLSSLQTLRTRHLHLRLPRPIDQAAPRAGPPSASTLFLVFVLPLSLLIGTILVSIRIGNQLDEKFLQELEVNQAMMEGNEGGAGEEGKEGLERRKGEEVRIRNRPIREV